MAMAAPNYNQAEILGRLMAASTIQGMRDVARAYQIPIPGFSSEKNDWFWTVFYQRARQLPENNAAKSGKGVGLSGEVQHGKMNFRQ